MDDNQLAKLKSKGYVGAGQDQLKQHYAAIAGTKSTTKDFWSFLSPTAKGSTSDIKRVALIAAGVPATGRSLQEMELYYWKNIA